jgi:hypothetical protein
MSAIANIVVPDAAGTPVNHTFLPETIDKNNVARWNEKTSTLPVGYWSLAQSMRKPVATNGVYRYTLDLAIPTTKTYTDPGGNSVTVVDYVNRAQVTFLLSDRSVLQSRKDIRKLLTGILADTIAVDQIENLNNTF